MGYKRLFSFILSMENNTNNNIYLIQYKARKGH